MRYLILLLLPSVAFAAPIHRYDFSVTATNGPLAGQSAAGHFAYRTPDHSAANYDAFNDAYIHRGIAFTEFDFTWNNVAYTAADVLWGYVSLAADGSLKLGEGVGVFGPDCHVGGCTVLGNTNSFNVEFFHRNTVGSLGIPEFLLRYRTADGGGGSGMGLISYLGPVVDVPEPGTFALLAIGLLSLGRLRAGPLL